ncbi:MAG: anthranilate phosphoribosyltransferase, partial [Gemmatimonadetes bacterium]|nr:anthranilate phosphoribosyltransferase [Gemmatimonadota bacterium]
LVVHALAELEHVRALVVHGEPGMDEITPEGSTRVAELVTGVIQEREITPEDLGLASASLTGLAGGEPEENAELIRRILEGNEHGSGRTACVLNAAGAIWVGEKAESLDAAVAVAEAALDSGAALDALERLKEATNR